MRFAESEPVSGAADGTATDSPEGDLGALFRVHHLELVRLATILTGDQGTAEDVVQDAFERMHAGRGRIAGSGVTVAYLRTAVINGCRGVHRKRSASRRHEGATIGAAGPPGPGPGGEEASHSAEHAVLLAERYREVAAALAALPPRRREVLVLRYYLQLSEAEIAATLNISTGTVKSSAARGLAALARALGEE
jgi:RNA polymerase sigma-70 factor (sigma-E family)